MAGSGGRSIHRGRALAIAVAAILLSAAPAALAADAYVDRTDGDDVGDTNDCRDPDVPCATLGRGIGQAGTDDTVFVGGDPSPFTVPHDLGNGKSIVGKDFSTDPAVDTSGLTIIDTGSDPDPAIRVESKAGKLKHLYIQSQSLPLQIEAGVTVDDVRFDESAQIDQEVYVNTSATVKIEDSVFFDPTPNVGDPAEQFAIRAQGSGKLKISRGIFDQFSHAIVIDGSGPVEVSGTVIQGVHPSDVPGAGIWSLVAGTDLTVTRTELSAPDESGTTYGFWLSGGAEITRTLVHDHTTGVFADDAGEKVVLDSSAITTPAGGTGLQAEDTGSDDPDVSDVKATNVTISGEDTAISLSRTHLRLASGLIEGALILGNGPTCKITHSRGPAVGSGDCTAFQTDADPELANDGFHLTSDSPMIDKGDPEKPEQGAKDIDGDKRALDGKGSCEGDKRRDIGADEFVC